MSHLNQWCCEDSQSQENVGACDGVSAKPLEVAGKGIVGSVRESCTVDGPVGEGPA